MKTNITNKFQLSQLLVIAANLVIAVLVYMTFALDYLYSLATAVAIIAALLILERKGVINKLFSLFNKHKKTAFISFMIIAIALPFIMSSDKYVLHIAILACIYAICALGLNFQMGSTDMTNFAAACFFGIGAYTAGVITVNLGWNSWLSIPAAAIVALIFGLIIGAPTLRTKGFYLSLVTMSMQLIFTYSVPNIKAIGGADGIIGLPDFVINLFGFEWDFGANFYLFGEKMPYQLNYLFLSMIILMICVYVAMRLNITKTGLAWNNIAQDEVAAECFGINTTKSKLTAFCIGALFCGVAGALYAHYMMLVTPEDFTFNKSLIFICMVILGGMDNTIGVVVGAFLLTVINEKLRSFADYQMLMYGLILMTVLVVRPEGLIPKRPRNYCECYKLDIEKREEYKEPVGV